MRHSITLFAVVLLAAGCGSDSVPTGPTEPPPVAVVETFSGSLNVNGGRTHPFVVERAGTVTAQITALSAATVTVGLSLGTWNGAVCQIILANDAAVLNFTVTGTAQATGQFCVRLYDVGNLTAPVDYSVDVSHF